MLPVFRDHADDRSVPLVVVRKDQYSDWVNSQDPGTTAWLDSLGFKAEAGRTALLPGPDGRLARVLLAADDEGPLWAYAALPMALPEGSYRIAEAPAPHDMDLAALGWALGGYRFNRYRKAERAPAQLVWPEACDRAAVERTAGAVFMVRDLVNTPANDLGPAELAAAAEDLAGEFGADIEVITGSDLLARNYPAIHTVGRGSSRAPRLIDLRWGPADAPRVTVVGKGVCFDSGGLDLKPSGGMLLMKKDMGGAAHALALARMIMAAGLRLRLRLMVPAVENMVSGDSFRPLDVIRTRKGLTVEVGNTDAEGRLILCDALTEADTEQPALLVDFATLTGAARIALGPELPAMFCNDEATAAGLLAAAERVADPLWRLPLHEGYRSWLDSKVADLVNVPDNGLGGAITAALFLREFVPANTPWAHYDLMAWNQSGKPGRPQGGEAMALRATFAAVQSWLAEREA